MKSEESYSLNGIGFFVLHSSLFPKLFGNAVDNLAYISKDYLKLTITLYVVMQAFAIIPADERSCLVVINAKTLLDCLLVII